MLHLRRMNGAGWAAAPESTMRTPFVLLAAALAAACSSSAVAQVAPYNPYAENQEVLQPLAADGTIQWGTFYKSASIQKAYERLWNLGACRGTNKAITVPVERNKIIIDNLPESEFQGVVRGTAGTLAGGLLAFAEGDDPSAATWVATLHPAGVSHLTVAGQCPAAILQPGMFIRLRANVDSKGKAAAPVKTFDIVTPAADFKPDPVRPNRVDTIVGKVLQIHGTRMLLHVDAGRLRRLSLSLAPDAVATIDASQLELVAPGDAITVTGRLWSGECSMGAGTIFASKVTITKSPLPATPAAAKVSTERLGASVR